MYNHFLFVDYLLGTLKHIKQKLMSYDKYLIRASGLGVMTSRLQRGGHRFNSGLAHSSIIEGEELDKK